MYRNDLPRRSRGNTGPNGLFAGYIDLASDTPHATSFGDPYWSGSSIEVPEAEPAEVAAATVFADESSVAEAADPLRETLVDGTAVLFVDSITISSTPRQYATRAEGGHARHRAERKGLFSSRLARAGFVIGTAALAAIAIVQGIGNNGQESPTTSGQQQSQPKGVPSAGQSTSKHENTAATANPDPTVTETKVVEVPVAAVKSDSQSPTPGVTVTVVRTVEGSPPAPTTTPASGPSKPPTATSSPSSSASGGPSNNPSPSQSPSSSGNGGNLPPPPASSPSASGSKAVTSASPAGSLLVSPNNS
jgi:hypothetical protein